MFNFDILSGKMNSSNLLSALDLNTPRYRTRGSEFLRIGFHRTNYGLHEPMSDAMREFNEVIGLFNIILTRNQFIYFHELVKHGVSLFSAILLHYMWQTLQSKEQSQHTHAHPHR
jgi:hypothetical protein